jgi:multidrug efflux system membrane fusion protein
LTGEVQLHICIDRYRYAGIAVTHFNITETQELLRQTSRPGARKLRRQIASGALLLVLGGGYALWHTGAARSASQAPPPASPVAVETLRPQTIKPFKEFSGRIDAVDYAEIRPQVSGRITEIHFQDGQTVKAGDVLFVIDPRPFQAAVAKAAADLETARTNAALAKVNLARAESLKQSGAIALQSYDQAVNASAVSQAAVASAAAVLEQARLDVDHAYVKAPITGRISRAEITLGNLVGATPAPPLLASIASKDGVYADFELDEQTYLSGVRGREQGQSIPVEVKVQGDSKVYRGTVESFDNHIDSGSGTIRARARFANEDGALVPGMFVSVRMGGATQTNAILVPETAVGSDQSKRFVFVVGAGSKAEYRPVSLGVEVDGERVVTDGLKPGDRLILDGLQKLAPGAPVAPHPVAKT